MNIQIFVCFHKQIFPELYEISKIEQDNYLTYYGVKDNYEDTTRNIIYEYNLAHYNANLQKKKYNEGSCIYHVYKNNLYNKYNYIGFCQYDMKFQQNVFKNIEYKIMYNSNTIFYLDFFQWAFLGGQTTITEDYYNVPAGLNNYNKFFNKNYTTKQLISNKMIICNTFIISKQMYEKMMSWLIQYFIDDINVLSISSSGHRFDPGHMIEALTSMFLSLEINEGAKYEKIDITHNQDFKNVCY